MATEHKKLKPEEIIVDQRLQVRKALDAPTVERYAALIGDGERLPWIDCGRLKDDGPIYLIDGFHRYAAYAQHPTRDLDCLIKTFDSFDGMFEFALMCNMKHGLTLTEEERRDAIQKVIQLHPEESQRQLAWRCGCSKSVIGKYQNQLATRGQFERPEKVVGIDGKARPTTVTRKKEAVQPAILPPEPTEEDFEEPADYQPLADSASVTPRTVKCPCCGKTATILEANDHHSTWEPDSESFNPDIGIYEKWYCSEDCMERYKRATNIKGFGVGEELPDYGEDNEEDEALITAQKPKTCRHFCAGGCGTPIWEEMKEAADSTYICKGNLWFCSEECYRHSWHYENYNNDAGKRTGPTTEEKIMAKRGDSSKSDDEDEEPESEVIGTPTPEDLYMRHCWNAGAKREADEDKDEDLDDDEDDGPCERCWDYIFDQPDPSTLDPAALPVPRCPFDPKHRPRLGKVSNNGYDVRCNECRAEGRRVDTFVEKSWKKAYAAWGCYDGVEADTLDDLLDKNATY